MEFVCRNKTLQNITNQIKKENILLKHRLQRREGQWNRQMKSDLIDSLLRGYPINPTYTVKDDGKLYTIDGVQRFSCIRDFRNDVFALSKTLDPVMINGVEKDIAGKKFSKLDEDVQEALLSSELQVYEITEYTDKDIREMFRRQNSGKPLNSVQKSTAMQSDELSNAITKLSNHSLFEKVLTPAQLKSSVDASIAIEVLMLSELSKEYDFGSFRNTDKTKFIEYYNDRVNEEKVDIINQAMSKLDDSFGDDIKIPKTSISVIIYGMYRVIKDKKSTEKYLEIVYDFLKNYDNNEEYLQYCQSGTSNADMVKGRLDYFRSMIRTM